MDSVASFKQEAKLETDKKINLVYGLNGTGKSTISNYLYEPNDLRFFQCTKFPQPSDPILVYNQSFIQDNFHIADSLKGVFSLSKENKSAEEKIEKATERLTLLNQNQEDNRSEKQEVLQAFESQKQQAHNEVWKIKSIYAGGDRVLEYCLDGLKGKKDRLFEHIHAIAKPEDQPKETVQTIRKEVEALKGDSAQPQSNITPLQFLAHEVESNQVFEESILGNADSEVAQLIENLGSADWVKQGLEYIPEHVDESGLPCPFCQEPTITSKLIDGVKGYFDDTYQQKIEALEKLQTEYIEAEAGLLDISAYIDHQFAEKYVTSLTKKHQELIEVVRENVSCIEKKIKNPKLPQVLKNTTKLLQVFNDEVKLINTDINNYNTNLSNRESTLKGLKNKFWSIMRWQYDQTISRFDKDRLGGCPRTNI